MGNRLSRNRDNSNPNSPLGRNANNRRQKVSYSTYVSTGNDNKSIFIKNIKDAGLEIYSMPIPDLDYTQNQTIRKVRFHMGDLVKRWE
jgi:hypothetical protein